MKSKIKKMLNSKLEVTCGQFILLVTCLLLTTSNAILLKKIGINPINFTIQVVFAITGSILIYKILNSAPTLD